MARRDNDPQGAATVKRLEKAQLRAAKKMKEADFSTDDGVTDFMFWSMALAATKFVHTLLIQEEI